MSKKSKVLIGVSAGLLVGSVTFGVVGYADTSSEADNIKSSLNYINKSYEDLFSSNNKEFFKKELSIQEVEDTLNKNESELKLLESRIRKANSSLFNKFGENQIAVSSLNSQFKENQESTKDVKYKLEFNKDVAAMFNESFLLSEKVDNLPTVNLKGIGSKVEKFNEKYKSDEGALKNAGSTLVKDVKAQKDTLTKAHSLVGKQVNGNKVISENEKEYKETLKVIETIQDKGIQKELNDSLKPVKDAIAKTQAETEARLKKEREEQEEKERLAAEQAEAEAKSNGFSFNGYSFPIQTFYGLGKAPLWTPYVFVWDQKPNHYMIERQSDAGAAILSVDVGSQVTINGSTYTVYKKLTGLTNSAEGGTAGGALYDEGASISFHTCETNDDWSTVSMWFAH